MLWRSGGGRLLREMLRYGADRVGCDVDELHTLLVVIVQPQRFRGSLLLVFSSKALYHLELYLILHSLGFQGLQQNPNVFPQSLS